jgi:RHS repeat-associated protein
MTLAHGWDADHRLRSQTLWGPAAPGDGQAGRDAGPLWHRTYTYRPDGHLAAVDDSRSGRRAFDLDAAGRVTAVHARQWDERYVYDAAGNLTEAVWPARRYGTADGAVGSREYAGTLIRRAGRTTFEHDAQGRVVGRSERSVSGRLLEWRYTWDAGDRLVAVTTPTGERWRYRYDPLGRRIAKQRLAPDGGHVVEQIDFTWDDVVLAERTRTVWRGTGAESRTTTWEYEPGTFRPMTQVDRARSASREEIDRAFYAIVADMVGTPTEMIGPAGDAVWRRPDSSLWGTPTTERDVDDDCPLRFANHYHDAETGLDYNYFRYYDPATARYQSVDPLGIVGSPNPYAYVSNPFHEMDPLGLIPCVRPRPDGELVFSGHGSYKPKNGMATVPHGTSISFYAPHGASITDRLGNAIETGTPRVAPIQTYHAGDSVPNYTLHWPGNLEIRGTPETVLLSKNLSELFKPNMGRVHWAACQYERGHPLAEQSMDIP